MINTIDPAACTGCGTCTKTCPLDVFRLDTRQKEISPCMAACPAGVEIRHNNYLIQQGRVAEAVENFKRANPFPAITGRVCFHPCESGCARAKVDEAVNINALEQYLGDVSNGWEEAPFVLRHLEKVAVVGAGPAGLSCAYYLASRGYQVTVFEAMPEAGGMLRYGIPAYRLPDEVVLAQVKRLERMGVRFFYNTRIGEKADISLPELKKRGFKAVLLAPGTTASRKVDLEGVNLPGVFWGLEFLRSIRSGEARPLKGRVVVIGGGDVAVDAAISARHLGAEEVHMVCLEDEQHMPAYPHNQADAREEGILIHCGFGPARILGTEGVTGMEFVRCLSVTDAEGRFAPSFDESDTMKLEADAVIFAIGQMTELEGFASVVPVERGRFKAHPVTFATPVWGVFAAGDAVFIGADMAARRGVKAPEVPEDRLPGKNIPTLPRNERRTLVSDKPFGERKEGLELEAVFSEALRCMTCGSKSVVSYTDDCMTCFNCELNCPSDAIYVHPFKERFARTLDQIEPAHEEKETAHGQN